MKKKLFQKVGLIMVMVLCSMLFVNYTFATDLISTGQDINNRAQDVIDNAANSGLSNQEKTMFNQQFTIYAGKQSGASVKEIISKVNENNSEEGNNKVTINITESEVENSAQYDVKTNTNSEGLVNEIVVTKSDSSSSGLTSNQSSNKTTYNNSSDNSTSQDSSLPKTGESSVAIVALLVVLGIAVKLGIDLKKYDYIK